MAKDKDDSELFDGDKRESRTAASLGERETREMSERKKAGHLRHFCLSQLL